MDKDLINESIEKMRTADGIILGSPTYFADVSASMKAFIERSGMVSRANGTCLIEKREPAWWRFAEQELRMSSALLTIFSLSDG